MFYETLNIKKGNANNGKIVSSKGAFQVLKKQKEQKNARMKYFHYKQVLK